MKLPQSIDLVPRLIGESVRTPDTWVTAGGSGCRVRSPAVIGWSGIDKACHSSIDRPPAGDGERDLQALLGCAVPSCESPCRCIRPRCAAKGDSLHSSRSSGYADAARIRRGRVVSESGLSHRVVAVPLLARVFALCHDGRLPIVERIGSCLHWCGFTCWQRWCGSEGWCSCLSYSCRF